MNKLFKKLEGDLAIWMVVILLFALSILAVYSSSAALAFKTSDGNTEKYIIKHLIIIISGFLIMYGVHRIPYKLFSRTAQVFLIITIPLLIYTLFKGEAGRWLTIPIINQSFQTSDLAKLALIMYLARVMSRKQDDIKDFKLGFLPVIIPIIVICGLILWSNFSTAALVFVVTFLMMFIGGISLKHIGLLSGVGVVLVALFVITIYTFPEVGRFGTWKNRIENFRNGDSESNYQAEQAKMAIASGGLFGKLPGNSTMRNFLPQAHNDFIYALIIEEFGLVVGGIVPVLLYLTLLYSGVRLYLRSSNYFGSYLVIGITLSLLLQASVNMGVAVGLFPVTGQAMPLVSMGGTSIWFTCIAIGVMLSVSRSEAEEASIELDDENEESETLKEEIHVEV